MTVEERLEKHLGCEPQIANSAYIAEQATLIGDVILGEQSSVWPGVVMRGDINSIRVGAASNIQDGSVVHLADDYGVMIGDYVTVGHMAMVHACTIEDECLIGMHATILDGAVVGKQSIVGAGTLVKKGMHIPEGSMVVGVPGRIVRTLSDEERNSIKNWAIKYVKVAKAHKVKQG